VDSVHESWTTTGSSVHCGPRGSTDTMPLGRDGTLTGAWPPAALGLRSSPMEVENGEGRVANPFQSSPGCKGRRDGQAMMVKWRQG
jgi:hypothetical protein